MNKYRNVKVQLDGYTFDSKKEARRYQELLLLVKAKAICDLVVHPRYRIEVNGMKICDYIADFRYWDKTRGWVEIVEDTKGLRTGVYRLKKKLMKAVHGIEILET